MRSRTSCFFTALGLSLISHGAAHAGGYAALDLGDWAGVPVQATGMNNSGQVAGFLFTADGLTHAFVTGANGVGLTDLGTALDMVVGAQAQSRAQAINDGGTVVGWSDTFFGTQRSAAKYTAVAGAPWTDLASSSGFGKGVANAINASGSVVGNATFMSNVQQAFYVASGAGSAKFLGTLSGGTSTATGINSSGQVVGSSSFGGGTHAFVTSPQAGSDITGFVGGKYHGYELNGNAVMMLDLGTLGGSFSTAYAINDAGQVVGGASVSPFAGGWEHAFIADTVTHPIPGWSTYSTVTLRDLGTLGGRQSEGDAINALGEVVGWSSTWGETALHAFITGTNGQGMTDLNSLVTLADGAYLADASAINDAGQVLAHGSDGHSYLLTPSVPEPQTYSMVAAALVLIRFMVRRKVPAAR